MFTGQDKENQKNKFYSSKGFSKNFNPHFNPNYNKDKQKNFENNSNKQDSNKNVDSEELKVKNFKKDFKPNDRQEKPENPQQKKREEEEPKTKTSTNSTKDTTQEEKKTDECPHGWKRPERCVSCEEYLKLKYQLAEMINKYKQLDGEFENYRKRTREEMKDATTKGKIQAIELLLPALDSFKKAKRIVTDEKNLEGINLIEKSLMQALEKQNVKKIDCIGKEFDPDYHNAVAIVDDPTKKPNVVIEEIEAGYTIGEKVVKFSQVVVNKKG